jgi:hypothetical protein
MKQLYEDFKKSIVDYYQAIPKGIYKFPPDYWILHFTHSLECKELVKTKNDVYINTRSIDGEKIRVRWNALIPEQLMYIAQTLEDDIQNKQKDNSNKL